MCRCHMVNVASQVSPFTEGYTIVKDPVSWKPSQQWDKPLTHSKVY